MGWKESVSSDGTDLRSDPVPAGHLGAPVAAVSGGVIPADGAAAGGGVAALRVSVTGAGAAGREAPVTRQAAVALPTVGAGDADALTTQLIADWTLGPLRVACTLCKTQNNLRKSIHTAKTQNITN